MLPTILHDWPYEMYRQILKSAYEALEPNGKTFIHEMLLDENKTSPTTTVFFDLLMFINHQSQQFTQKEIFHLLGECGFKKMKHCSMFGYFSLIEAIK